MTQWTYRPTEGEQEAMMRVMADHPEYPSVAQVIREAFLRFLMSDDKRRAFTEVHKLIDELTEVKQDYADLLIRYGEE
jgi:hypothetical protein